MTSIKVTNIPVQPLFLGFPGENDSRPVYVDVSPWLEEFPDATVSIVYTRSDGLTYAVVVNQIGPVVTWKPMEADLVTGECSLQIQIKQGDAVKKDRIVACIVGKSLDDPSDPPQEPRPTYVEEAIDAADRAEAAVTHYPKIVNGVWFVWDAETGEFVSTGISAQGEDGYSPTVTVAEIEGGHRVTITDADGAHTFDVMDGEGGSGGGAVDSVNGKTGVVVLDAEDVGALPDDTQIPSKTSDLTNNSGFVTAQQAAASAPVQSVNGETGAVVLDAADVHALPDSTVIPPTVTEQTVSGWGFTKNTGDYTKPSGGIPKSDLASAVQTSLGKADTALQQHQSLAAYRTSAAQDTIDAGKLGTTGNAYRSASIPMGHVDSTSTATAFTATVDGITELRDGVCMWLRNGVITSASGFTININSLGAKPCYSSLAAESRSTTIFNVNYALLMIYNSTRVDGGCWDIVYGVDTNTTYTPPKLGFGYGTCTTAAATAAKTASISSYALTAGGIVSIHFDNDVPSGATLNISSKGAKAIHHRGAAITAGVIKGGDTATFVYSTYYHLIAIDRDETADLTNYQTKAITDTGGYYTTDTVDGALQEIGAELAGVNTLIGSGVIT